MTNMRLEASGSCGKPRVSTQTCVQRRGLTVGTDEPVFYAPSSVFPESSASLSPLAGPGTVPCPDVSL